MNTGFVGIGSMGGMLSRALLRSGALIPNHVWAANRSGAKLDVLRAEFTGVHVGTNREVVTACDLIFLCLKPTDTAAVLAEIYQDLHAGQLLVTLASLITVSSLEERVPCRAAKLIPSITQENGSGVALLEFGARATAEDRALLQKLLAGICRPLLMQETLMRIAADLVSCGPAFVAYLLESLAESALADHPDLPLETARGLVWEMASATMRLMSEARMTPQELIQRVAVPGGNTALGIEILSRYLPQAWADVHRSIAAKEARARDVFRL
jgi:competence protein ComER